MTDRVDYLPPCEWPKTVGSSFKCGRPWKAWALSPGRTWWRSVCGIHVRSARSRGWTAPWMCCGRCGVTRRNEDESCFNCGRTDWRHVIPAMPKDEPHSCRSGDDG